MWLGLASAQGNEPRWRPLARVTSICGLTLGGGVHEDLERASVTPKARQSVRNPHGLRLVSHRAAP
jgi:hypothetical protein